MQQNPFQRRKFTMAGHPISDSQDEIEQLKKELRGKHSEPRSESKAVEAAPASAEQLVSEPADAPEPRVYIVQKGDTLSHIAKQVYDDATRWREIYEANKDQIKDPKIIRPGQELRIP
jgi:nucleoid-associated protein YgaU